eukprot:5112061-Prorocentrum_lima.AAC.1
MAKHYRNQIRDLKNKLVDLEETHRDDVTAIRSHVQVQGSEEWVLRARIEPLQEEQSNQAQ